MAYDEAFANRIRSMLPPTARISEKKMFGGIAFLLDGKMAIGIANNELMVRVGPEAYEGALARPHVRPMDFTGRPLVGYVYVDAAGIRTRAALAKWVSQALAFVDALPVKPRKPRKPRPRPTARTSRPRRDR